MGKDISGYRNRGSGNNNAFNRDKQDRKGRSIQDDEAHPLHHAYKRACMHTFDGVYPEYTLKDFGMHYTLEAVGNMRVYMRIHSYVYNL